MRVLFGLAAGLLLLLVAQPLMPAYRSSRDVLTAPGREHLLGTNDIGQDVLTGLLYATPNTVLMALAAATVATATALIVAGAAAAAGATTRNMILRLVDALQVMPSILVLLFIGTLMQPGLAGLALLLGLTSWHEDVRVALAMLRRELQRENVRFARHMGASRTYCLRRHVLPAIRPALAALYLQNIRQVTLRAAGLAFLGLTDPRLLTWGGMMQDAMEHLYTPAWLWLLLPPALALTAFLLIILLLIENDPAGARA
ncbi:ABC transporter permease subunit [Paracoccus alkanivorans]|nr:ABC transporter permease subunit [Paracoccus alkanivorans]